MPALLSSCRRVGDEARFDSGEQISCIIQDPAPARNGSDPLSLGKKESFLISRRAPNNDPLRNGRETWISNRAPGVLH